ncbi:MAG: hypothetical protein IPK19_30225 [Chloroflexi bacterium]|nr:hypothetical protein [Chloroflexota bacterium]
MWGRRSQAAVRHRRPTLTPHASRRRRCRPIPPGALSGTVIRAQVLLVRSGPFLGAPVVDRVLRGQTYQVLGRDENRCGI